MMIIHNNLMKGILLVLACLIALASSVQAPRTLVPGPNCYISLPTDKCAECQFGFLIINETCVASPHRNCKTFDPYRGICTSCYVGYALQADGSCAVDPTVNVFQNCAFILFGTYCLSCDPGYYFNFDGNCELIDPNCQTFDYVFTTCSKCKTGYVYYQSRGQCIPNNSPPDASCTSWIGDVCFSCINGFTLYDGICVEANPQCRMRATNFPFDCVACFPGYVIDGNDCIPEAVNNPLCKIYNPDRTCKTCSFRAIKNPQGICINVNPLCKTWNNRGRCTSCFPGYGLNNGNCVISTDTNCLQWSGSRCIACIPWTWYDGSKCVQVNTQCRTYNRLNGQCTSCYGGWALQNGTCVVSADQECRVRAADGTCTACYGGYYYNLNEGRCVVGNSLCNGMDFYGNCLGCYGGYYLKDGECILQDPLCASFNYSSYTCSGCYTGYTLNNGTCS